MNIRGLTIELTNRQYKFCVLILFASLSALYFSLIWKADDNGHLIISILFYVCLATRLANQAHRLSYLADSLSIALGSSMCLWILVQGLIAPDDYIIRLFPFAAGLGTSLIAFSWKGLQKFTKELLLLFFLGVPSVFCYYFVDISPITAKFSALMLWYSGQNIWNQSTHIGLIGGKAITVVYDCSGIDMVNYFLALSVLCLIQYPLRKKYGGWWLPFIGMMLGFIVNCCRIVMLVLFNNFDQNAFKDWHTGNGSYTFAILGVFILGGIYWLLLHYDSETEKALNVE